MPYPFPQIRYGFPEMWTEAPIPPGRCEVANSHLASNAWQCLMSPAHIARIPAVDQMPLKDAVTALRDIGNLMLEGETVMFGSTPGDFPWWRFVATFGDRAYEITGEVGIYCASIVRNSTDMPQEFAQKPPFNGCRFVFSQADGSNIHVWPKGGDNTNTIIAKIG